MAGGDPILGCLDANPEALGVVEGGGEALEPVFKVEFAGVEETVGGVA